MVISPPPKKKSSRGDLKQKHFAVGETKRVGTKFSKGNGRDPMNCSERNLVQREIFGHQKCLFLKILPVSPNIVFVVVNMILYIADYSLLYIFWSYHIHENGETNFKI